MDAQGEMKADEHHPSCTPNDRDLIWFCNQCGARESAEEILEILEGWRIYYPNMRKAIDGLLEKVQ
jgi:hypothetical protein